MPAISYKLPKIQLDKSPVYIPPVPGSVATGARFTINFNYKHFPGGSLSYDWTPEYAADMICADDYKTRKKRFNGYRFIMNMTVTDRYLKSGVSNGYEQELFETYLNTMSIWEQDNTQTIYVYPFNDLDEVYQCTLDNYVKANGQSEEGFKTKWHTFDISLSALQLTQTKPLSSY